MIKVFALLLAVTSESLILLWGANEAGKYVEFWFPAAKNMGKIALFSLAFFMILASYYRVIRLAYDQDKKSSKKP